MIKKRILAIMLILCMCMAFIPINVFAVDTYTVTISAEDGCILEVQNNMLKVTLPNGGNDVITFVDSSNNTEINAEITVQNNEASVQIPVETSFKLDFHYDFMNVRNNGNVITATNIFDSTSTLAFRVESLPNFNPEDPPVEAIKFDFTINGESFTNVSIGDQLVVPDDFNMDSITELYFTKISIEGGNTYTYAKNEYSYDLLDDQGRKILETHFDKKSDNYANIRIEAHSNDLLDKDIAEGKTKDDYFGFYITGINFVKSGFKGVEISTNVMPDNYDFTVWNGSDLSATTLSNPGQVTAYYGESTIKLESKVNSQISKIELVSGNGVPDSAVEINSTTGEVKVKSNYYNEILLKITLQDGTIGYVNIQRIGIFIGGLDKGANTFYHGATMPLSGNINEDTDKERICAVFYHDDSTTYQNYDLIVNILYIDGTTETKLAKGVGDVTNNETHLTGSDYILWAGDKMESIKSVSVTAVKKGATTNETIFSGATFGAGAGVKWENNS